LVLGYATFWTSGVHPYGLDALVAALLLVGIPSSIVLMLAWGSFARGQARWIAFDLAAIVLIGFSIAFIWSIGALLLPVSLGLLIVSTSRLVLYGLFDRH
jgi:hypothetical protein